MLLPALMHLIARAGSGLVTAAIAAAMLLVLSGHSVSAAPYKTEYKLSTVLGPSYPFGMAAVRWAEIVKKRTNDRIRIRLYPGVSLVGGDQTREFTAIRQGIIDMAIGSTINWSPQVGALNLFSLPFLMPDHAALDALTQGPVGRALFEALDKNGVVPLVWGENGFRQLSNRQRPIRRPEDIRGLKIRVVGSPIFQETFTALGASPVQMSWTEAHPALIAGQVDGQENPEAIFVAAKLAGSAGQKHLTLWNYVADPLVFVVNRTVWESWSPADREIVRTAAQEAAQENIASVRRGITEQNDTVLRDLEEQGVTVVRLTAEERQAFQAATRPVYERWAERIGRDLVTQAELAVANRTTVSRPAPDATPDTAPAAAHAK